MICRFFLAVLGAVLACASVDAQAPSMNSVSWSLGSGPQTNSTAAPITAWTDTIIMPTADSVQVHMSVANLSSSDDRIVVRGLLDGAEQVFDQSTLKYWENYTAWFNGSAVQISLILAPGSDGEVSVDQVWLGSPDVVAETICGPTDNRTVTTDVRVCRVVPSATAACTSATGTSPCGASAFMISSTSTICTARHVAILSFFSVAEFNVPLSTAGGSIVHPGPEDQYPIDRASIVQSAASVVGDDWAVARLHPNSTGDTASARQGAWFALAAALPAAGTTLRITGFGVDSTPDLTRHNSCQTHTGPLTSVAGTTVNYQVDTENANSGSGVRNNGTDQIVAIHTNGGCNNPVGASANAGTSILNAGLQTAITTVSGCTSLSLSNGASVAVNCTNAIFDISPPVSRWVGVGVTSLSDWDASLTPPGSTTTVTSGLGGNSCDYLIANGNLGTIAPVSGRFFRSGGADLASAEYSEAFTMTTGSPTVSSWSSSRVLRLYQFNVTTAGNHDVSVFGETSLNWRLYSPGTNDDWRPRGDSSLLSTAAVGASGTTNVALATGWHCIVVYRNGGTATPSPTTLTLAVCPSGSTTALIAGVPSVISSSCQRFSLTPSAIWNVVGIASDSGWSVGIGPAWSSSTVDTVFAVANGYLGAVSPSVGRFLRTTGTDTAVAEHTVPNSLPIGSNVEASLAANSSFEAREFNVTVAGAYEISVTGASGNGLFWRVFEPGADSSWRPRADSLGVASSVGDAPVSKALGLGRHLLVAYRNGAPLATATSLMFQVCLTAAPIALSGFSVTTLTGPCQTFTCTPDASAWNAVGVSSLSDWDVGMGDAFSRTGGSDTDFVIQNGNLGSASPLGGVFTRFFGADSARGQRSFNVLLASGVAFAANWPQTYVVRVFEFNVAATDNYDIQLSNAAELSWRLYAPGTNADWRSRFAPVVAFGTANGVISTRNLAPGDYAIAVYRDGGEAAATLPFTVLFRETPNPVPSITTLAPTSTPVGSLAFNLTITGTNIVAGESVARWNGAALATVSSTATSIVATVPASLLTSASTAAITVFTPAAGGGTSNSLNFNVTNPVPVLGSISPTSRTAGLGLFVLTLNGSGYNADTLARWNGANLPTSFVSPTQVTAMVAAALTTTPGTANVSAFNPAPGGGTSVNRVFTINHPVPTLGSLSPASVIAGGAPFLLTVNGSGFFNPGSVIRWNGMGLTTTFVSSTQITANITALLVRAPGSATITVFNGSPGGGTSGSLALTLRPPIVGLLGTTSIPVLVPASTPINLLITGTDFLPSAVAYADSTPLLTTFLSSALLQAQVGPTVPGTLLVGGVAIAVENGHFAPSNALGLAVGGGSNVGTIVRHPLNPVPGEGYSAVLEGAANFAPMLLILDASPGAPVYPFPDVAANFVLSVRPGGLGQPDWLLLSDTIGLYGAPFGLTYGANGRVEIPGFVAPNPTIGVSLTVQGAYLDPGAPLGFRITWARFPDQF